MRITGNAIRQFKSSFFGISKIGAAAKISQVLDLVVRPAVPPCQGGVRSQSIFAAVDLRSTNDDQLLELGGNRTGIHYRTEVANHAAEDLGPVCHSAEHVRHVAPL